MAETRIQGCFVKCAAMDDGGNRCINGSVVGGLGRRYGGSTE